MVNEPQSSPSQPIPPTQTPEPIDTITVPQNAPQQPPRSLNKVVLLVAIYLIALCAFSYWIYQKYYIKHGSETVVPSPTPILTIIPSETVSSPTTTPIPVAKNVDVISDWAPNHAQTVYNVDVGTVLNLSYEKSDMSWNDSYDTSVLEPFAKNQLKAIASGSATIKSTGRPICAPNAMCPSLVQSVTIPVVVSGVQ